MDTFIRLCAVLFPLILMDRECSGQDQLREQMSLNSLRAHRPALCGSSSRHVPLHTMLLGNTICICGRGMIQRWTQECRLSVTPSEHGTEHRVIRHQSHSGH